MLSNPWAVQISSKTGVTWWLHFCGISQRIWGGVGGYECYDSLSATGTVQSDIKLDTER